MSEQVTVNFWESLSIYIYISQRGVIILEEKEKEKMEEVTEWYLAVKQDQVMHRSLASVAGPKNKVKFCDSLMW